LAQPPTRRDHLLYGVGRVCEAHVLLDWTLGILQAELAILANPSDPAGAFRPTLVTACRIARCQELLPQTDLPQDLKIEGDHALNVAREANADRKWMPEGLSYEELIPVIRGERPFTEGT
jgi:hypothetical protein